MRSLKYLLFAFVICFVALSGVFAADVCTYTGTVDGKEFTYECTIGNSLDCKLTGANQISYKKYLVNEETKEEEYVGTSVGLIRDLEKSDFLDSEGNVDCSQVKSIKMDMNITATLAIEIYQITNNTCSSSVSKKVLEENPENKTYIKKASGCKTFTLKNTGSETTPTQDPSGNQSDNKFNTETFCEGAVQGVFTTLGWVFYILKILIPIILIIFGSVDFGKAILSSKDDEIKKSAKTLVMRTIAGIIIFFVPTILNLVVELVGEEDLYNGTFRTCTHCMLEPTDEACRKLVK